MNLAWRVAALSSALIFCAIPAGADDSFLVDRAEFDRTVSVLRLEPTTDSLRASVIAKIVRVFDDCIVPAFDGGDTCIPEMTADEKEHHRSRYLAVARKLLLNDSTARDSFLRRCDAAIAAALPKRSRYRVASGEIVDSMLLAHTGTVRTSFRIADSSYVDSDDGGDGWRVAFIRSCLVVLDAWIVDQSGKPLWHSRATVATVDDKQPLTKIFSEKNLAKAVAKAFKPIF